ncbi:hypothetical protein B0J18DRAFT_261765 [Chaetomium sp. MPI-SDFR-AT-0129]|nr:hypothetical protein B0J18DRAFT_261765 [Chaetomium sp. MPI-SDFR-AT-0129]
MVGGLSNLSSQLLASRLWCKPTGDGQSIISPPSKSELGRLGLQICKASKQRTFREGSTRSPSPHLPCRTKLAHLGSISLTMFFLANRTFCQCKHNPRAKLRDAHQQHQPILSHNRPLICAGPAHSIVKATTRRLTLATVSYRIDHGQRPISRRLNVAC